MRATSFSHYIFDKWLTAHLDIILKVADILTVKGGTGAIVEYHGKSLGQSELHVSASLS